MTLTKLVTILWQTTEICSNPRLLLEPKKNYRPELQGTWCRNHIFLVLRHGRSRKERCGKNIANLEKKRLNNFTKSQIHAWMTINIKEENESMGENFTVCSHIVLKCLYLARFGRPDILWQCCYVGNTAQQCRLGLFQDSDFAVDLEDSNSTSRSVLCIFGSHTFVPMSWCVRSKPQFHTVQQNQTSFLLMQDWGWMVSPHLIYGIWSSQFLKHESESWSTVGDLNKSPTRSISPRIVHLVWKPNSCILHIAKMSLLRCCLLQYSQNKDHQNLKWQQQDHGYHIQTARLRWTSSRRSISLYPSENGRFSQFIQNSQIGVSRHLDSSTTTRMA